MEKVLGAKPPKKVKKESSEQIMLVARIRQFYPELTVFAIPNGGYRHITEAVRMRSEGVLAGTPDLFIAKALGAHHGLFIEMKRTVGGKVSEEQKSVIAQLRNAGYCVEVARGCEEGWKIVENYLKIAKMP